MFEGLLEQTKSIPLDEGVEYSAPFTLGEAFEDTFKPLDKDTLLNRTKDLSDVDINVAIYSFLSDMSWKQAQTLMGKWGGVKYKARIPFIQYLVTKDKLRDFYKQEVLGIRESFEDTFQSASDEELSKRDMDAPVFLRRIPHNIIYITNRIFYLVVKRAKRFDIKRILDKEVGPGIHDGITSKYEMADGTKIELDSGLDREGSAYIRVEKANE